MVRMSGDTVFAGLLNAAVRDLNRRMILSPSLSRQRRCGAANKRSNPKSTNELFHARPSGK
jgi:hypothetical protein